MTTLYGIKNCDTVKKARKWLDTHNIDYRFHDFREDGLTNNKAKEWIDTLGWETIVNKRSTTWKQLDQQARDEMNESLAIKSITQQPTLVKRPVLEVKDSLHVGFKEADYLSIFE